MSDVNVSRLGIYQAIFTERILVLHLKILGGVIVVVVCTDCIVKYSFCSVSIYRSLFERFDCMHQFGSRFLPDIDSN